MNNKNLNDLINDLIEIIYDCLSDKYRDEVLDREIENAIIEQRRVDGKYIDFISDFRPYILHSKFAYTTIEMIGNKEFKSYHALDILDLPIMINYFKQNYNQNLTKKDNKNIKIIHWGNEYSIDYAVINTDEIMSYLNEDENLFMIVEIQELAEKISDYIYQCIYNGENFNFKVFYHEIYELRKGYCISKDIFFNLLCRMLANASIKHYEKYELDWKQRDILELYEEFDELDDEEFKIFDSNNEYETIRSLIAEKRLVEYFNCGY